MSIVTSNSLKSSSRIISFCLVGISSRFLHLLLYFDVDDFFLSVDDHDDDNGGDDDDDDDDDDDG